MCGGNGIGDAARETGPGQFHVPASLGDPRQAQIGTTVVGVDLKRFLQELLGLLQVTVRQLPSPEKIETIGIDLEGIAQADSIAKLNSSVS